MKLAMPIGIKKKKFVSPKSRIEAPKIVGFFSFKTFSIPSKISGKQMVISVKWLNQSYHATHPEKAYARPEILAVTFFTPRYLMYT